MCFPHALVVARRFLSTQQLCLMATASTVPMSETIDMLHERSMLPESLVQQMMPDGAQLAHNLVTGLVAPLRETSCKTPKTLQSHSGPVF